MLRTAVFTTSNNFTSISSVMLTEIPLKVTDVSSLESWTHVAASRTPSVHVDFPDTVYPTAHVGLHVAPCASAFVHVPTAPFMGALEASHESGAHVAAVSFAALHLEGPETAYPVSQTG